MVGSCLKSSYRQFGSVQLKNRHGVRWFVEIWLLFPNRNTEMSVCIGQQNASKKLLREFIVCYFSKYILRYSSP